MFKTQINRLLLAVVLLNLCAAIGCHRGYYRRQADAEAKRLILQKSNDPRWNTASGNIDIDPQSRMFDPFSADHPPIPPDDPASHQLMHCVDGKPGYPQWNANGDTNYVENPDWRRYLPVDEKGQVVLTLDGAFQLALINSPEYQEARETLYLSALDVSLDRFGFDSQMDWGLGAFTTLTRGDTEVRKDGDLSLRRLGITGTTFAVGLANTILWNFGGNDTQSATSLIDFSIIQPLLRGAGRDRIMESLTQSERTLLANVRLMERFRRNFYLQVAIGRNLAIRLQRAGDFLGIPGSAGTNAGGYFGLLERQQRIRNQELNVRQLEQVLSLFREFFLRERLDAIQLKRFETTVYRQQRTLLDLRIGYQTTLDQFKRTLGLPPDLDIVIDDTYIDGFALISDQVNEQLILANALRGDTGDVLNGIDQLFEGLDSIDDIATGKFVWPDNLAEKISELTPYLDEAESTLERLVKDDREEIEADINDLENKRDSRLAYLNKLKAAIESGQINSPVDPGLFETESIPETDELREILLDRESKDSILNRAARAQAEIANVKAKVAGFKQSERELDKTKLYEFVLTEFLEKVPGQLSEINNLVLEMSLLQARTRSNAIEIVDVDINSVQAIDIARCMRRDWMNARASLVDNWRNIEFVADQLESQLDLVFEGNMSNDGNNPFKLRYETGQLRAGFRFDAPIVRLAERNNYRAALISYQQTRRDFYQFEDSIKQNLREITRNIDRNKVLFELDRRTVQVQIENVEINRYELEKPVGPGQAVRLGSTTAQNLADAIIGLNSAQDAFLGSWIEYEVLRRNLDFDMGTMQLDERGEWIDPGTIDASLGQRVAAEMGISLDCQFCTGVVAPGFAAGSLISDPAPSVVEPQPESLQFESEIPVPVEIERIEDTPAPQSNQSNSAIRSRPSILSGKSAANDPPPSQAPGLLFRPVNSRIESTVQRSATGLLNQNQVQARQDTVPAAPVITPSVKSIAARSASLSKSPETETDSSQVRNQRISTVLEQTGANPTEVEPLKPNQLLEITQQASSFPILPKNSSLATPPRDPRSDLPLPQSSADLLFADRIANQISEPLVKQTSSIEPTSKPQQEPLALPKQEQATGMTLKAVTDGSGAISPTKSASWADATSPASSATHLKSADLADDGSDWQSRASSLGGLLNRFRTHSDR